MDGRGRGQDWCRLLLHRLALLSFFSWSCVHAVEAIIGWLRGDLHGCEGLDTCLWPRQALGMIEVVGS